jgi:hypothetical protein
VTAFARERVLDVPKGWLFWRAGIRAREARARLRIAIAQRLQPALGVLPQIVERTHETPPSVRCLASA